MPIMKQNERKIETERKIENAFLELVELKGFENVHLVDIAKRANVNRNTVYLRYGTKEDIIAQILDKTFAKRLEKISDEVFKKVKPTKRRLEMIFKQVFELIDHDIDLYRLVLTDQNLYGYMNSVVQTIRDKIANNLVDNVKNKIALEYMVQGIYGIIRNWIIYDIGTIEDNVKIIMNLLLTNVRLLTYKQEQNNEL